MFSPIFNRYPPKICNHLDFKDLLHKKDVDKFMYVLSFIDDPSPNSINFVLVQPLSSFFIIIFNKIQDS